MQDGLIIESTKDLHTICQLANYVRHKLHGKNTGYIVNAHLNYTNICISKCSFCYFFRNKEDKSAYTLSYDEAVSSIPEGIDEIHVVGGVNPDLDLKYFEKLISVLHNRFPNATIKAFTAVEIHALAKREKFEVKDILQVLKNAGLGMLPGGGAEIFSPHIRSEICPGKISGDEWIQVHETAHFLGIPSNSTMLFGHIEAAEDRIKHLIAIRECQDRTNGFIAHIPLPCLKYENASKGIRKITDGGFAIRQIALARLMLDNVPHIKSYWPALGLKLAEIALTAGADDLDGVISGEKVMQASGSDSPPYLNQTELERIIISSGMIPYRRDSFHKPIKRDS